MDIAKIRKKVKQSSETGRQAKSNDKSADAAAGHDIPPDDKFPAREPTVSGEPSQHAERIAGHEADIPRRTAPDLQEKPPDREKKTLPPENEKEIETERQEEVIEILTFRLAKEEFAFRISELEEILRYQQITIVPNSSDYVLGITSLRGKIIPVIDLKCRLSLAAGPADRHYTGKILIVKGPRGPIGVAVDKVIGVVRIAKSEILPPPAHFSEIELKFVDGIAVVNKRFVSLINMEETVSLR